MGTYKNFLLKTKQNKTPQASPASLHKASGPLGEEPGPLSPAEKTRRSAARGRASVPAAQGQAPPEEDRGSSLPGGSGPRSRGTRAPNPVAGEEGGTGFSARTSASAAPHRREAGLMAQLSLTPRSYRRTPGSRSPGSGGLAGSLLPAATASGSGPAAGEHREPSDGGHGLG